MNRSEPPSAVPRPKSFGPMMAERQATGNVTEPPRVPELDALRGLACLVILAYHFKPRAVPFGWAAVDLFFVLSGYLITGILIKHRGTAGFLASFYARRGLRIWPIYYLTVVAVAIAGPWLPKPTSLAGLPYYLTYTQNVQMYWSGHVPAFSPYVAHLWTLANEEQFYLLWPALVCLVGARRVIPLAVLLAGVSVAARAQGFDSWLLLARADGFALGGLLAAILAGRSQGAGEVRKYRAGFVAAVTGALAYLVTVVARGDLPSFGRPPVGSAFPVLGLNVLFASVVGLVVLAAGSPALRVLRGRRLCRVGTISYGLYMYHFVVLMLVGDVARALGRRGRPFWMDVLMMAITFALANLSWRFVEAPILSLKGRFAYAPPRPIAPARAASDADRRPTPVA